MIRPVDSIKLAITKLKTRKVRLVVTLVISSLLFGVAFATSLIIRGSISSVIRFQEQGLGGRYLVSGAVVQNYSNYSPVTDKVLIDKAKEIEKQLIAKKKAESKRLGIEYSAQADQPFVITDSFGPANTQQLNIAVPEVAQLLKEESIKKTNPTQIIEKAFSKYGITKLYPVISMIPTDGYSPPSTVDLKILIDGKEDLSQNENNLNNFLNANTFSSYNWQLLDQSLLEAYLLENQNLAVGKNGSIPILPPFSGVEKILKLKPLTDKATVNQKIERIAEVRKKAAGLEIKICYRNYASVQSIQDVVNQQQEIERNKTNKEYLPPSLIFGMPQVPCGPTVVTKDKRTTAEKLLATKQNEFNKIFNINQPKSDVITARIVGITPGINSQTAKMSIDQIIQSIFMSNYGAEWVMPVQAGSKNTTIAELFNTNTQESAYAYIAEFPSAESAQQAIKYQNTCMEHFNFVSEQNQSQNNDCVYFNPYGSNSIALGPVIKGFNTWFKVCLLIVSAIASLIMTAVVGRIIADSRRETAVFRAIGAKRSDISQIYYTYTFIISAFVLIISIIIGCTLAVLANHRYGPDLSISSVLAFNASDLTQKFDLIGFDRQDTLYIVVFILGSSMVAATLPLLTNVRRNPIRDMRDE